MKLLLSVISFTICSLALSQVPHRTVLLEKAAGVRCSSCVWADINARQVLEQYPDNISVVSVQGFMSGHPVPSASTMDFGNHDDILKGLGLVGYPSWFANRTEFTTVNNSENSEYQIDSLINSSPSLNIDLEVSFDEESRIITTDIEIYVFEAMNGDFKIGGIIKEDGVTGIGNAFEQSNSASVSSSPMAVEYTNLPSPIPDWMHSFNHISRALIDEDGMGIAGSLPENLEAGQTYFYSFNYEAPDFWDWEYIKVVGFVLDENNQVLNAGESSYLNGYENAAPFWHSTGIEDGYRNVSYQYNLITHDPEGNELEFELVTGPNWLSIEDYGNGFGSLKGIPPITGEFEVVLKIDDGFHSTLQSFIITVTEFSEDWIYVGSPNLNK